MAYRAGFENQCALLEYRGFESRPLRYAGRGAASSLVLGACSVFLWDRFHCAFSGVVGEYFSFYLAEVESAVGLGEVYEGVHLLVDEGGVVAHDGTADDRQLLAVLGLHLGNGKIEPAL